jgi:nucleoside-diphosphate-sugar epimerase
LGNLAEMKARGSEGLTVAVTGVAGYVGSKLARLLADDPGVERILGFDLQKPAGMDSPKFIFDALDVRSPALEARLRGVDVVIHLAFVMDPIRDEASMRDVNVNGTQNLFKSAGKAGVPKIIYTSSATVYGAHPDNDFPLTEESPLRANLDFSYPAHKLEVEYVVREFREEYPETVVTVFRPAVVLGPHVDNAWSHVMELPMLLGVQGYKPRMQFIHEDDVADALRFAVTADLDGAFNLAAEGWLEWDEIMRALGKRRLDLPEALAFGIADRLWGLGMNEAPAGMLHYVMHPWVVGTDKLTEAGFTCRQTNMSALLDTIESTKKRVRIAGRSLEKRKLKRGASAGLGLVGSALLWRRLRAGGGQA